MKPKNGLLVGPGAAGLLGWDGFAPGDPSIWLVPHRTGTSRDGVVRSRLWRPNGDRVTAPPDLVLAHLLEGLTPLDRMPGDDSPICVRDRFELGLESYLRNGGTAPATGPGRCTPSIRLARQLIVRRGVGEPATESYLETRTIQVLRQFGYRKVFRQLPLLDRNGRTLNRIDIVVPLNRNTRRPAVFTSDLGVPIEADGRAFHADTFEKDRRRNNNMVAAGARVLIVTSTSIEFRRAEIKRQLKSLVGY